MHSTEAANWASDFILAEDNLFLNKNTYFEVYNLAGNNSYNISKVASSYLALDQTIGTVGNQTIFDPSDGNIYLTESNHSSLLLSQLRSHLFCTGKNFTLAVVGASDNNSIKIVAIDKVSKAVTTLLEKDIPLYSTKISYSESEDKMYFILQMEPKRVEVYQTNGTTEGTTYIRDIKPINYTDNTFSYFINNGEALYVVNVDNESTGGTPTHTQFHKIDGAFLNLAGSFGDIGFYEDQTSVKEGTFLSFDRQSKQLVAAKENSYTYFFQVDNFVSFQDEFNTNVVFSANSTSNIAGDSLVTLFETNGTSEGTNLIADNVDAFFREGAVKAYKGHLYFLKEDVVHGRELWRHDGNKAYLLEDIVPGAEGLFSPRFFIYDDALYFTARLTENPDKVNLYKLTDEAASIKLSSFADYNSNQVKDPDEPFITNLKHTLSQVNRTILTSESITNVTLEHGTYTLNAVSREGWQPTSDDQQIDINLPEDNGRSYSFGYVPEQLTTKVDASIMSEATRCGFPTPFTLHYSNSGFTKASGTLKLKPEAKFVYESASPAPGIVSGDTLIWEINDMVVGKKGRIIINFTMPGVDHIGDTLLSHLYSNFHAPGTESVYADTTTLQQILTCSYDPNDIQANPAGIGEKHLTLKNQEMEYLIRFQNMGTDKAFNIVVQNELQPEFDMGSFKIINSSHDMYTAIEGNQVSFHFDNIQLPDDKVDEPGSHGYILYSIKPIRGLADSTLLTNQAFIYFDYNPAIETNVAFNTLVDKLPLKTVLTVEGDLDKGTLTVFPNPTSALIRVAWPAGKASHTSYSILSSKGQMVLQTEFNTQTVHQIDMSALPPGLYILKAIKQDRVFTKRLILR